MNTDYPPPFSLVVNSIQRAFLQPSCHLYSGYRPVSENRGNIFFRFAENYLADYYLLTYLLTYSMVQSPS